MNPTLNNYTQPYRASGAIFKAIQAMSPELTAFRRDLHAHPEIGFEEVYTAAQVAQMLKLFGADEVHTQIGKTGVVGVIRGKTNTKGAMIGLRADMDALPLQEHTGLAWQSGTPNMMHACGHDGHTAMLMGAAKYLAQTRNFDGTAIMIFQPGEEGFAGAKAMLDDGLFERFPVQSVYAIHNSPEYAPGIVGVTPGPMQAAADRIEITITGKGGHGARPYNCVDPVVVAAHIITAAQSIVARNISAFENAVVSICAMQAGNLGAMSVIPGTATLVGTVRTFDSRIQTKVEARLRELCTGIAAGFGATAALKYEKSYPATINTVPEAMFAADVAASLVGEENVLRNMEPSMGAEDFSFMLQAKPGAYIRIGQGNVNGHFLHNSRYDFNDAILPLGAAVYAGIVEAGMKVA